MTVCIPSSKAACAALWKNIPITLGALFLSGESRDGKRPVATATPLETKGLQFDKHGEIAFSTRQE